MREPASPCSSIVARISPSISSACYKENPYNLYILHNPSSYKKRLSNKERYLFVRDKEILENEEYSFYGEDLRSDLSRLSAEVNITDYSQIYLDLRFGEDMLK